MERAQKKQVDLKKKACQYLNFNSVKMAFKD